MSKILLKLLSAFLVLLMMSQSQVFANEITTVNEGAKIFEINCAGCHPNGNNIIRRGKNLKQKALQRNNVDTVEKIAYLISNGQNNMSAFKERLSEKQINLLATYVLEKAQNNWK